MKRSFRAPFFVSQKGFCRHTPGLSQRYVWDFRSKSILAGEPGLIDLAT